jgi:uncharacterized protein YbaR (Trm112 family)
MDTATNSLPNKVFLGANNSWNQEGIKNMRTPEDGDIVVCPTTKKELFYIRANGSHALLESFGKCSECKVNLHASVLHFFEGVDKASWAVEYTGEGVCCIECYQKL